MLGKKTSSRQEPSEPFYQSIPFLVAALMLTATVAIWFALPPNAGELVARSRSLVESSNAADWETAAVSMKRVMKSESKFASQAEQVYQQAQRKKLLDLAKRGMKNRSFHSLETRSFVDAYALEQDKEIGQAKSLYAGLVRTVDPAGSKAHVYLEAKDRFKKLASNIKLPETAQMLLVLVEQAKQARTEGELDFAKRVLTRIYVDKSGEPEFENVVDAAKAMLDSVERKLESVTAVEDGAPLPDAASTEPNVNQNAADPNMETKGMEQDTDGAGDIRSDADQP